MPRPPQLHEPVPTEERRGSKVDPLAPMPATAVAYRLPDPIKQMPEFLAAVVLSEVLAGGEASRLYQRLVKEDRLVADVGAAVGSFGDPYEMRDPTILQILAWHPGTTADERPHRDRRGAGQARVDVDHRPRSSGSSPAWCRGISATSTTCSSGPWRSACSSNSGDAAELVNELPGLLGEIDPAAVVAVNDRWVRGTGRAVLEVLPGGEAA